MTVIDSKEAVLDTSAIMSLVLKDCTTDIIESKIYEFDYFHISDLTNQYTRKKATEFTMWMNSWNYIQIFNK